MFKPTKNLHGCSSWGADSKEVVDNEGFTLVQRPNKSGNPGEGVSMMDSNFAATSPPTIPIKNAFAPLLEFANEVNATVPTMPSTMPSINRLNTIAFETFPRELFHQYADDEALFLANEQIKTFKLSKVKKNKRQRDHKHSKSLRKIIQILENQRLPQHAQYVKGLTEIFNEAGAIQQQVLANIIHLTTEPSNKKPCKQQNVRQYANPCTTCSKAGHPIHDCTTITHEPIKTSPMIVNPQPSPTSVIDPILAPNKLKPLTHLIDDMSFNEADFANGYFAAPVDRNARSPSPSHFIKLAHDDLSLSSLPPLEPITDDHSFSSMPPLLPPRQSSISTSNSYLEPITDIENESIFIENKIINFKEAINSTQNSIKHHLVAIEQNTNELNHDAATLSELATDWLALQRRRQVHMRRLDNELTLKTIHSIDQSHLREEQRLKKLFDDAKEAITALDEQNWTAAMTGASLHSTLQNFTAALGDLCWDSPFSPHFETETKGGLLSGGGSGGAVEMPKMLVTPPTLLRCGSPFNIDDHGPKPTIQIAASANANANQPPTKKVHKSQRSAPIPVPKFNQNYQHDFYEHDAETDVGAIWACVQRIHELQPRPQTPPFQSPTSKLPNKPSNFIPTKKSSSSDDMQVSTSTESTNTAHQYCNSNNKSSLNKRRFESAMMAIEVPPPSDFPSDESAVPNAAPTAHPSSTPTNATAIPSVTATDTPNSQDIPKEPTEEELAEFAEMIRNAGEQMPPNSRFRSFFEDVSFFAKAAAARALAEGDNCSPIKLEDEDENSGTVHLPDTSQLGPSDSFLHRIVDESTRDDNIKQLLPELLSLYLCNNPDSTKKNADSDKNNDVDIIDLPTLQRKLLKDAEHRKLRTLFYQRNPINRREQFTTWLMDLSLILNSHTQTSALITLTGDITAFHDPTCDANQAVFALVHAYCDRHFKNLLMRTPGRGDAALQLLQMHCARVSNVDRNYYNRQFLSTTMHSHETITVYLKRFTDVLQKSRNAGNTYSDSELIDTLLSSMQYVTNPLYLSAKAELLTRRQRNDNTLTFADVETQLLAIDESHVCYRNYGTYSPREHANHIRHNQSPLTNTAHTMATAPAHNTTIHTDPPATMV